MSAVGCRGVESFALFQVFFSSFHLYLKGSSDLDRVGSMVGEQDAKKWRQCAIRRDDESAQLGRNPHEQNCQAEPLLTVMSIQLLG